MLSKTQLTCLFGLEEANKVNRYIWLNLSIRPSQLINPFRRLGVVNQYHYYSAPCLEKIPGCLRISRLIGVGLVREINRVCVGGYLLQLSTATRLRRKYIYSLSLASNMTYLCKLIDHLSSLHSLVK